MHLCVRAFLCVCVHVCLCVPVCACLSVRTKREKYNCLNTSSLIDFTDAISLQLSSHCYKSVRLQRKRPRLLLLHRYEELYPPQVWRHYVVTSLCMNGWANSVFLFCCPKRTNSWLVDSPYLSGTFRKSLCRLCCCDFVVVAVVVVVVVVVIAVIKLR